MKLVDNAEVVIITYKGGGAAHAVDVVKRVAEQLMNVRTARAKVAYKEQAASSRHELKAAEDRAAEGVKGAGEGRDQNGEAQTILNQRVVSLRTELRAVQELPPGPGTVLAITAPRQAGVRKLQLGDPCDRLDAGDVRGSAARGKKASVAAPTWPGPVLGDTTIAGEVRAA